MDKIISYSLWGENPKYLTGAIRNIQLAKIWFPEWKVRIYVSDKTSFTYSSDNLDVIYRTETQSQEGCFWRFESCDSDDIVIIRDLDDRLSERHKFVVDEWLDSDKNIHIIRDHPNHVYPIMAGLWGCRGGILKDVSKQISKWKNKDYYTTDQDFLGQLLYNDKFIDRTLIHDPFHKAIGIEHDINLPRIEYEFLGDTFDEHEKRVEDYWMIIKKSEKNE
jgi:hypothetical protein